MKKNQEVRITQSRERVSKSVCDAVILNSYRMFLIAGSGNPGDEYRGTRHNIGREIARRTARELGAADFTFDKKRKAQLAAASCGKEKILLVLPETFVNKTGAAIGPLLSAFKIKPKCLFLIHDDADIALGSAKLSFGRNSAGHKGVESVIKAIKTKDFWRFRIGIAGKRNVPAEKLVLKKFTPEEERTIKRVIKKTVEAVRTAIEEGPQKAMNDYNR